MHRKDISVTIIEGGDRIIPAARPEHSKYVHRFLVKRGVRLLLGSSATRVEPKRIHLENGTTVDGFTILWTAGVHPPEVVEELPLTRIKDGRVRVDGHLRPLDSGGKPVEDVYVLGDCAASMRSDGAYQPALSQTGIAMGLYVGKLLAERARGRSVGPFQFKPAGYIISLGKNSSVLELFGIPVSGRLAWLLWAGAYLIKMVGLRKQIEVGIDHLTHLMFEHDTSQILARRAVLADDELNLALAGELDAPAGPQARDATAMPAAPLQASPTAVAPAESPASVPPRSAVP